VYDENHFIYSAYFAYVYHGWNTRCCCDWIRGPLTVKLCIGIVHQIWSARVQPACVVHIYNYHQLRSVRIQSDSECTYIHMRTAWKHPKPIYMYQFIWMCFLIYAYVFICVYKYIYIYTCIHISICIHKHIHMYVFLYVYLCIHIQMCIYICVYTYIYSRIYICMYLCVCVYICI